MDGQTQQRRQKKRARPPVYEERIQDGMHVILASALSRGP